MDKGREGFKKRKEKTEFQKAGNKRKGRKSGMSKERKNKKDEN